MKIGEDLVEWARPHADRNEKYVLGAWAPKADVHYRGPWDCAEFVSAGVYQCYGFLRGCFSNAGPPNDASKSDAYTGYWARDIDLGRVNRCSPERAAVTPGALLLRRGSPIGHIAICTGDGLHTIEAASSTLGVVVGKVWGRRWTDGITILGVAYKSLPAIGTPPTPVIIRLTSPYTYGPQVSAIQRRLGVKVDGIYGPQTMMAVLNFQRQHKLVADGEVGPLTLKELGEL